MDAIVVNGTAQLAAAQAATKSIPIVFAQVSDPGGNITGCTDFEYGFGVKWLEILREIAPHVARAAILYDPNNPNSAKFLPLIEASATSSGITLLQTPVRDADDITRAIDSLAGLPPAGLIVLPSVPAITYRDRIIAGAALHRLPAVYPYRSLALAGGLVSYGVDVLDMYRVAASYVDRILKGEKAADLPVQFATRFEFVINLKSAKQIGLLVPTSTLLHATETVE